MRRNNMTVLRKLTMVTLVLMASTFKPGQLMAESKIKPTELRYEFRENPSVIDVPKPLFSWKFKEWNQAGQPAGWSAAATFLTGKMSRNNWSGKWIGTDILKSANATKDNARTEAKPVHQHGAIYLRKEFQLSKPAIRAVVSSSGLGFSELPINGRKVGDYVIGPGFTDYDHRIQYLTFDVSDRFKTAGTKQLEVILADGWYALKKDPGVHKLEKNRDWKPVIPVVAPRGQLQHQKETFNRIVEEVRPVTMKYDPVKKPCVWDFGCTINGWVRFKANDIGSITESGKPAGKSQAVNFLRMEDKAAVYEIGSGRYEFKTTNPL